VVVVFGIFLPWWLGYQFLDPVTLTAYCCLGVMFAAPAAAQAFGDDRPQSMREALKRIAMSALYGESMALVILVAGFMTAYFRSPALFVLDIRGILEPIALGAAGTLALASISAVIGLMLPKGAARMALRVIFLGLLLLFFFRSRWLPDVLISGSLVCLGLSAIALAAVQQLIANTPAPESRQ
jgi:hypothetical protein